VACRPALTLGQTGVVAVCIRPAVPAECPALSDLALRSKGYWGYDPSFLEACRDELTVDPADVDRLRVTVAEGDGHILGFYALGGDPPEGEIWFFFVAPERIGTGIGRTLWRHCLATAARIGLARIRIESDPNARGFYLARGAVEVGETPSQSIPGRSNPLLALDVESAPVERLPE